MLVVFGTLGYFACEFAYNNAVARYDYRFSCEQNPSYVLESSFYDGAIDKIKQYNEDVENGLVEGKKISYANIDYKSMVKSMTLSNDGNIYTLSIKKTYFPSIVRTSNGTVNEAHSRVKTYFNLMLSYGEYETSFIDVSLKGYVNPFLVGGITLGISFVLIIGVYAILFYKLPPLEIENIYDNEKVFKTPFHKQYWKNSLSFFKSIKSITLMAMLFALMLLAKLFSLPSGFGALGISITYLFFSTISMIFGPIAGILIGILSDTFGYFINQTSYMYFPGYTLDAMLSGFIYGICFYQTKITFTKCLWARIFVNFAVNVCLGSLWWGILYGLNFDGIITYVLTIALPKNIVFLLPQSIVLFLYFKIMSRVFLKTKVIDEKVARNVSLF